MPIQYGTQYKAPKVTYPGSAQAKKNTTGYRDPFPSLSGNAVGAPSRMQQQAPKAGGYGQPAKPPAQFAQQQQQPAPAAPQTPKVSGYSLDTDPVLNQINALATMDEEGAQASAQNLRRQLAGQYGDPVLARQAGASEAEAAAAGANPDSVTAQIAHNFGLGQQNLEDQLNASNLFYSGARVRQLGELAGQRRTQEYTAANELAAQLGGIEGNLNSALTAAARQRQQAEIDAAARAAAGGTAAGGTAPPAQTTPFPAGTPITAAPVNDPNIDRIAQTIADQYNGGTGYGPAGDYGPFPNPIPADITSTLNPRGQVVQYDPGQAGLPTRMGADTAGGRSLDDIGRELSGSYTGGTYRPPPPGGYDQPFPETLPPDLTTPLDPNGNVVNIGGQGPLNDPILEQIAQEQAGQYSEPSYGDQNATLGDWNGTPADIQQAVNPVGNVVSINEGLPVGSGAGNEIDDIAAALAGGYGQAAPGAVPLPVGVPRRPGRSGARPLY